MAPFIRFSSYKSIKKTISWWKIKGRSYPKIVNKIKSEEVRVLCVNCHILERAFVYQKFNDFILKNNLFQYSPEELEEKIDYLIYNHFETNERVSRNPQYISDAKFKIKIWIKKRIIIEELYGGKCIGCRNISVQDNLPAFNFHHLIMDHQGKKTNWRDIKRYDIKDIVNLLHNESCVCLCANCHRMYHNINFKRNIDIILSKDKAREAKLIFEYISSNLKDFQFKKIEIRDPFQKKIKYGEIWKEYLANLFILANKKRTRIIISSELPEYLGKTRQIVNKMLN